MSGDMMLAALLAAIGVADLILSKALGSKLPAQGLSILQIGGFMMLGVAALLAFGVIRILG